MPRPPRLRFPPIRQFAFYPFHPKTRPSPSPLHLLRDGWEKCATAYSFSSRHCRSGMQRAWLWQAPASPGVRGSCSLVFAQVLKDGPQSRWSMVPFAACPMSPCHLPLGRLQRQPRLLAMGFAPVALLPSWPPLCNQWVCSYWESMQAPVAVDLRAAMGSGRSARAAWWELTRSLTTWGMSCGKGHSLPHARNTYTNPYMHISILLFSKPLPGPFSTLLPARTSE